MRGTDLQALLQQVGEDDLKKAAERLEADRAAAKKLRQQQGGMNVSELMLAMSMDDGEDVQREIPQLHEEKKDERPKQAAGSGFFPTPPGK